jgi:hypothetical protein
MFVARMPSALFQAPAPVSAPPTANSSVPPPPPPSPTREIKGRLAMTRNRAYNGLMTQMIGLYCAQRAHVGHRTARHALGNEGKSR